MFRVLYLLGVFCLVVPTVRLPYVPLGISDGFILAALGVWVWNYVRYRGGNGWGLPNHALWGCAVLILLGGLVSSFAAVQPQTSLLITTKVVFVLTVWVSMSIVMVRRGDLGLTIAVFATAICASASVALIDRWAGTRWGEWIVGERLIFYNRSYGTFGHPNDLGAFTAVALPLLLSILFVQWGKQSLLVKIILAGGIAICGLALFYSGSVSGWLSAVVAVGVMGAIWFLRAPAKLRIALVAGLAGLLIIGGAVLLSEPAALARVQFLLDYNLSRVYNVTGPGRAELIGAAFNIVAENPFVGAGMDQTGTGGLGRDLIAGDTIHNTIIGGWLAGGLLVFLGLVAAYFIALVTALRAMRWGWRTRDWLTIGLGIAVVSWVLIDQTQPSLSHRYSWLILAWLFAMGFGAVWSVPGALPVSRQTLEGLPSR